MPSQVGTLQVAQPAIGTVSRQPQTTTSPSPTTNVPFNRLSRQMCIQGPTQNGLSYGDLWTPILKPVGGYLQALNFTLVADGGSGTGASATPDGIFAAVQQVLLRDPFGQPIFQADGFSWFLINLYSGQTGMLGYGNQPDDTPSFTDLSADGEYRYKLVIPFQLDSSGYGSLASMNASSQPQLSVQFNVAGQVYATPPSATTPGLNVRITERYWGAPVDHPQIAPPDVGSSSQWSVAKAQSTVGSNSYQRIVLPRVGTFIHTLILVLRDADNERIEAWPETDLTLWVDGVPFFIEPLIERRDIMYQQFGVVAPDGVLVYSFRDSVQTAVSFADTYDNLLPTTPATLLEIAGTFGSISSGPGTITAITGELYPVGGIPYNHLAG